MSTAGVCLPDCGLLPVVDLLSADSELSVAACIWAKQPLHLHLIFSFDKLTATKSTPELVLHSERACFVINSMVNGAAHLGFLSFLTRTKTATLMRKAR